MQEMETMRFGRSSEEGGGEADWTLPVFHFLFGVHQIGWRRDAGRETAG